MITGRVAEDRMAWIEIGVLDEARGLQPFEALIDTGFDGTLTLPVLWINRLGLEWRRRGRAILADGTESIFDMYEAVVIWDGQERRIAVDAIEAEPLAGMALLEGYELTIEVVAGGQVRLRSLADRAGTNGRNP